MVSVTITMADGRRIEIRQALAVKYTLEYGYAGVDGRLELIFTDIEYCI